MENNCNLPDQIRTTKQRQKHAKERAAKQAKKRSSNAREEKLERVERQQQAARNLQANKREDSRSHRPSAQHPEHPTLSRAQIKANMVYLAAHLAIPKGQLDCQLPLPKVYKYANPLPAHPIKEKLDLIMQGWQSQKTAGSQLLVDRVGLELACAWLLHDPSSVTEVSDGQVPGRSVTSPALGYVEPHLQERLTAALDRLAAE